MRLRLPRSLLGQFVAVHVATALIATIALSLGVAALLHSTADHYQRRLLRQQAAIVANALPLITLPSDVLTDGMAIAIIDRRRTVLMAKSPARPRIVAAVPMDHGAHFFRRGVIEAYSVPISGGRWIVASQDSAAPEVITDDIVSAFLKRFALLVLPIAALVPLIGALLTRRLTRRMQAVSATAAAIGPRTLDTRLPLGTLPSEVEPLAAATNEALDRLEEGFRTQTAFAADIAHELRTPLAVIRLRADAVEDGPVKASLLASVDRAGRVVTQLLALADLERPVEDAGEPLDLAALAEALVANQAPAIIAGGRSIALDVVTSEIAPVIGYPGAVTLALENLVGNAVRHTPTGTHILVRVGPGARLTVADDGPGVAPEHLARLKDRFWRADGSRSEGSGIGLSIVDRVARAHHGLLDVMPGPGGTGLCFEIAFGATTPRHR
ncbi:HAMP domain-containing sensor histidine kinase [Sphingomonas sp. PP-CC-3A-396]|uniref:sensor histidine kinase n=1 Tax=Sphingomonas sp. PP-CC-3A-396 TaxID=2135655 RepID=UPI0010D42A4B|nr:HAMP domain-containing sensor histidine kinase [Sphingomonas sp. PP-CC-3A-396]TCQ08402.1 signal transduction histidine kinase [Sphingomonas sp. PP-CC-3A-396]